MRVPFSLAALLAGLIVASAAHAQATRVYQWKDAQGVTHYADHPPPEQARKRSVGSMPREKVPKYATRSPVSNDCNAGSGCALYRYSLS